MRRFTDSIVRATPEGKIVGLAAVYYDGTSATEFRLYDNTWERIAPGAFDTVLRSNNRIGCYLNHDLNRNLGATPNTLKVWSDKDGLNYECQLDLEDYDAKKALREITRGDMSGSSFAGRMAKDGRRWHREGDKTIRTITKFEELWDVSPVYDPAYKGAGVMVRSRDELREIKEEESQWLDTMRRIERSKNLK